MEDSMEDKIVNSLDSLDINETDKLLNSNIKMNIDSATMNRIKKSVYNKTGFKKSKSIIRKVITVATAAVVLVMLSIVTMGVDNVANAFGRLFSFIPGYGIVENNKTIEYVVDGRNLTAENDEAILTIRNVIATKEDISISFDLEKKNFIESKTIEEKQKVIEELEKGGQLKKFNITLHANGKEYKTDSYVIGSGGKTEIVTVNFKVDEEIIDSKTTYTLEYSDYNLPLDFKLKAYDSFDSLEEIGPTGTINDISITAVTYRKDNKLEVELYSINKSKDRISSFTKVGDNGYKAENLRLQTSGGLREYTTPGSTMGTNNKFYFDISPEDKNLVLSIPYLTVESAEDQNISIDIPKEGEKLTLNKKIKFKDCTMIVTDVERTKASGNEYGALRMNIQYENKDKNKVMCNAQFARINWLGITQSGGYGSKPDQNDVIKTVEFYLEKGEDSVLRLKIENPEYYLVGEYKLEIK